MPSIERLNDGSFEILVRKAYLLTLQLKLQEMDLGLLDTTYDPSEPREEDVDSWGLDRARDLHAIWTMGRVKRVIKKSWCVARVYYYRHFFKHQTRRSRILLGETGAWGET